LNGENYSYAAGRGTSNQPVLFRHIIVIGAGPYGLGLAAKLQSAGADYLLLGRVMSFWQDHVPTGTLLLSGPGGLSFCDNSFNPAAYECSRGTPLLLPLPAEEFIAYGHWFCRNACPNPDERTVVHVSRAKDAFLIHTEDGAEFMSRCLVIAIGMKPFAFRPPIFAALPPGHVYHTSDLHNLGVFRGKKVAIIGSGQSAIECAALLSENKAEVEVLARSRTLDWGPIGHLELSAGRTRRSLRGMIARALNDPDIYWSLPGLIRGYWLRRTLRPLVSSELKPRLGSVSLTLGRTVKSANVRLNRVELRLDDGSERVVDYVVLGTGFRIDVSAIPFLAPDLRREIRQYEGSPVLSREMESSVAGLYFTGAAAAWSFGPSMWFVRGSPWASERLSRALLR